MKQRHIAAVAATFAVLGALSGTASAAPQQHPSPAAARHCATLAGSTVTLSTDVGMVERFVYNADATSLTATIEAPGPFPIPAGTTLVQPISTATVGPRTYMVSWVEAGGLTVSSVQNLRTGAVSLFWTYPGDDGSTVSEQHTGTVVCDKSR